MVSRLYVSHVATFRIIVFSNYVAERREGIKREAGKNKNDANGQKGILAVRKGFEPLIRFMPYTRFPGVLLQPLGHLTAPETSAILLIPGGKSTIFLKKVTSGTARRCFFVQIVHNMTA